MAATPRILLVCLGNICRSPTAEAALREAADDAGLDLEVDSAGIAAWHVGNPPDARTVAAGLANGLTVAGQARQVTPTDFEAFDLIVAMDAANLRDLEALAPSPAALGRLRLLRDYEPGAQGRDVPDPYHGGPDEFTEVVTICRAAAAGLVGRWLDGNA